MRDGVHPDETVGKPVPPPPVYDLRRENGLVIERNVAVTLRDGVKIRIDIYRPDGPAGESGLGSIIGWSPYGKQNLSDKLFPGAGVEAGWISPYTAFEAPDPAYWCPRGYAIVFPDPRGSWYSEGDQRHNGIGEAEDCYDLIEWVGTQSWSNGKVGMLGVSYLGGIQWLTAPLKPPHLAAISVWEAFSDWYREFGYHGGIRETNFIPRGMSSIRYSVTRTEDTEANMKAHPLYDAYWQSKEFDLEGIDVPAYIVASWSDQGFHTRGTLEAFRRISSRHKWLEVHGQKKWAYFYDPPNVERQRIFFDHFLKGTDDQVLSWPKVRIEVRERAHQATVRAEKEWPLARTDHQTLFLSAAGTLSRDKPAQAGQVRYDSDDPTAQVEFEYVFPEATELTGPMKLRLWVESETAEDFDVFVAIQKFDAAGQYAPMVFYAVYDNGPVALGWLRASHRELDAKRSTPERPVHPHTREEPLAPGVPVPLEIEIWPSSTAFAKGERLRLVIKGRDIYTEAPPTSPFARHEEVRSRGAYRIHAGGSYDSHLLVPVIPADKAGQ